jgi:hypothetical protein
MPGITMNKIAPKVHIPRHKNITSFAENKLEFTNT